MLFILALASAAEVGLSLGVQHVVNDPFVRMAGPSAGIEVRPNDWVGFGLAANVDPRFGDGDGDWKPLMQTLYSDQKVSPDLSRIAQSAALRVAVLPIRGTVGTFSARVGLDAGIGVVHTIDDLAAIQATGDPDFEATADQVHPAGLFGLVGEVRKGAWGGRFLIERMSYTETVGGVIEERKWPVWLALELTWWTGGRRPDATPAP